LGPLDVAINLNDPFFGPRDCVHSIKHVFPILMNTTSVC
jgi:hypothetical protein